VSGSSGGSRHFERGSGRQRISLVLIYCKCMRTTNYMPFNTGKCILLQKYEPIRVGGGFESAIVWVQAPGHSMRMSGSKTPGKISLYVQNPAFLVGKWFAMRFSTLRQWKRRSDAFRQLCNDLNGIPTRSPQNDPFSRFA